MMDFKPTDRDYTLGFIIENPNLLNGLDVPEGFFRTDAQRVVWVTLKELVEAGRPVCLATIAERVTGNGIPGYLVAITSGLIPLKFGELQRRVYAQAAEDVKKRMQSLAATDCPDLDELAVLIEEARRLTFKAEDGGSEHEPTSLILSEVEPKCVPWLWPDYIPLGRATLISGDPGSAKTWFGLDLAARLSKGLRWPDGAPGGDPAKTYYLTVEDDLADTIRPRIDSLGGDPGMIAVYNSEHPLHMDLSQPGGIARLEKELVRIGDVRLVVIDPIIDFSGSSNPNAGEEVRALLTPLIRLASKLNFALVLVGHLNKAQALSAIYRAGGSTSGWLGKCRAAFMVFRDINEKALRHVIALKANLAPQDPRQLEFHIINGEVKIAVSKKDVDIDEQLTPKHGPVPRERADAAGWLDEYFGNRESVPATEIIAAAKEEGISESTLRRAKKAAQYRSRQIRESGGVAVWEWKKEPDGQIA